MQHNTMLCDEYTQFISTTRTSQKRQLDDSLIDINNIIEVHANTY